jgi:Protein of unknown function (DUF2510)
MVTGAARRRTWPRSPASWTPRPRLATRGRYPDPSGAPGQRYFDGTRWTDDRADAGRRLLSDHENTSQRSTTEVPQHRPLLRAATIVPTVLALMLIGSIIFLGVQLAGTRQPPPPPAAAQTGPSPHPQSPPSRPSVATMWSGTWSDSGVQYPARLWLLNADPISGVIDIPGMCSASWTEVERNSDTLRSVTAHVTSGPCVDNQWNLTVLPNSLIGTDTRDPGTTVHFTPSASAVA